MMLISIENLPSFITAEIFQYIKDDDKLSFLILSRNIYTQLIPIIYRDIKVTTTTKHNFEKHGKYIKSINIEKDHNELTHDLSVYLSQLPNNCIVSISSLDNFNIQELEILSKFKVVKANYSCSEKDCNSDCKLLSNIRRLGLFKSVESLTIFVYECTKVLKVEDIYPKKLKEFTLFSVRNTQLIDKTILNFNYLRKLDLVLRYSIKIKSLFNKPFPNLIYLRIHLPNIANNQYGTQYLTINGSLFPQLNYLCLSFFHTILLLEQFEKLLKLEISCLKINFDNMSIKSFSNLSTLNISLKEDIINETDLNHLELDGFLFPNLTSLNLNYYNHNISLLNQFDTLSNLRLNNDLTLTNSLNTKFSNLKYLVISQDDYNYEVFDNNDDNNNEMIANKYHLKLDSSTFQKLRYIRLSLEYYTITLLNRFETLSQLYLNCKYFNFDILTKRTFPNLTILNISLVDNENFKTNYLQLSGYHFLNLTSLCLNLSNYIITLSSISQFEKLSILRLHCIGINVNSISNESFPRLADFDITLNNFNDNDVNIHGVNLNGISFSNLKDLKLNLSTNNVTFSNQFQELSELDIYCSDRDSQSFMHNLFYCLNVKKIALREPTLPINQILSNNQTMPIFPTLPTFTYLWKLEFYHIQISISHLLLIKQCPNLYYLMIEACKTSLLLDDFLKNLTYTLPIKVLNIVRAINCNKLIDFILNNSPKLDKKHISYLNIN